MTRNFHRWEVDPFFSAAEEVQDSADRLESIYRTWIHTKTVTEGADDSVAIEFHRRELSTALGTAKWQLEEFERAISYSVTDDSQCAGGDTPARHKQFVEALRNQISAIETTLLISEDSRDLKALPVVNLGQEEKDDLALFLSGSRASSHDDLKEADCCVSTVPGAGKVDQEASCMTSELVKSKNGIPHCFSTSACNSDALLRRTDDLKSDVRCWTHEVSSSGKLFKDLHNGNKIADLLDLRIDQSSKPVFDPTSEHFSSDGGENYAERGNGHHRSVSVGSGLSSWNSDSINDGSSKRRKKGLVENTSSSSNFWSLLTKKQQPRISKSGLKRWKDGDANANDHSQMLILMHRASDMEKGNGNLLLGGSSSDGYAPDGRASGDNKHYKAWGEGFQTLQRTQYALPSSRPVQIASAILVTLGLLGLLSFHVTASAL